MSETNKEFVTRQEFEELKMHVGIMREWGKKTEETINGVGMALAIMSEILTRKTGVTKEEAEAIALEVEQEILELQKAALQEEKHRIDQALEEANKAAEVIKPKPESKDKQ